MRSSASIQGNVLAAFNKDHQLFCFLRFGEAEAARSWLADLLPLISNNAEVEAFNADFSAERARLGRDPDSDAFKRTWANIGLTHAGLRKLSNQPEQFDADQGGVSFEPFRTGAAARAPKLGDTEASAPENWLFGRPEQEIDAVVTLAADVPNGLADCRKALEEISDRHGVQMVEHQYGSTLDGENRGHEHFGYKDGISQPGVVDFHEPDPSNTEERLGHPGTILVKPGEFVHGHPSESGERPVVEWMRDGSFQVIRRLDQDVPGWNEAVVNQAHALGLDPERLGAKLVGRWKNGAPLGLTDQPNDPTLDDEHEGSNRFGFDDDLQGQKTPHFSHIRKMYQRGGDRRMRRLMRRGIPFGNHFDPDGGESNQAEKERGLVFQCFCADIEGQFEFIQEAWANSASFGNNDGTDPVIGAGPSQKTLRSEQTAQAFDFERFVVTRGALYSFAPSIPTLERLAQGQL